MYLYFEEKCDVPQKTLRHVAVSLSIQRVFSLIRPTLLIQPSGVLLKGKRE